MRKTATALITVLVIGVGSVCISYWLFDRAGRPDVLLQLVRDIDNPEMLVVRLTNARAEAKRIDLAGLEYFLYVPADEPKLRFVQIQARQFFLSAQDRLERETDAYVLKSKEVADIKDVSILLRGLAVDGSRLGTILTCSPPFDKKVFWHGFMRSASISLDTR